ncbi:ribonuclease HI [Candidatus Saccharibacteria bacterium]|nr:ribonuclease HI [Candidatus Saccharibacteria bacterium]
MTKILWTDGSANPNPGPGGYAVIENGKPVRLGREKESSNIRMEGTALIEAMKYAGEEGAEIHTDSQFWVNVLENWAKGWKARGWKKQNGPIKNLELVKEAYKLYTELPIKLVWTRGHVGTEANELADEWANKARKGAEIE